MTKNAEDLICKLATAIMEADQAAAVDGATDRVPIVDRSDTEVRIRWVTPSALGGGGGGAPTTATYITQTPDATLSAEQALSALGTGLVKNTTGTGVLSIGVAGTDYAAAIPGSATQVLTSNGAGAATANSGFTFSAGVWTATGAGAGSVIAGGWAANTAYGVIGLAGSVSSTDYNLLSSPSNTNLFLNRPSGKDIAFNLANSTEMILKAGKKLGIGTTLPGSHLEVNATAIGGREAVLKGTVSDAGFDVFECVNGTATGARFSPTFSGFVNSNDSAYSVSFRGLTDATNDASDSSTFGLIHFSAHRTTSQSNPNNGTLSEIQNRKLFTFGGNGTTIYMTMHKGGPLSLGTQTPPSANAGPGQLVFGDTGTVPTPGTNTCAVFGDDRSGTVTFGVVNENGDIIYIEKGSTYTQTYATATATHANPTSATLTDSTGGTANTTVAAVSGTGDDATVNDNFADLTAQINALRVDLLNAKQIINQLIDDHQTAGFAG